LTAARRSGMIQQDAWHVVSLNNASIRPNCPQMTEKEQWPPSNSPNLNTIEISCLPILKPSPEAQNSFCITVLQGALGKIKKNQQFFTGPLNKAVSSFRNTLTEYAKNDGRYSENFFLYSKNCSHFLRCSLCLG